ncbi:MAG: EpsI family protein [Candidatus Thiodiazotropha sp. (ex Myrtea sp. 'scaly one' KF741663)]|nr:EpsI family protein [Candidatus Thiodiazotropha sp. (ex Myrtea sp. 'scaly one' KF741663)]
MDSSEHLVASPGKSLDVLLVAVSLVLLLIVYSDTLLSFYDVFSQEGSGQSHAPLLVLVCLFLAYRAWSAEKESISIQVNFFFILFLAGFSLVWMAAGLVFVEAGQQVSLILMAVLVVLSLLGLNAGRKYIVPMLILLTIVPVWSLFTPYLQTLSAHLSSLLLDVAGITSTREGYLLIIPNGTFEVADSCSGLNFLIIGITLALIHTQLTRVHVGTVALYVLSAAILAVVSNMLRIFVVVTIGYFYGMDHDLVQDHNSIGWGIFALLFFIFLFFGEKFLQQRRIEERRVSDSSRESGSMNQRMMSVLIVIAAFSSGPALMAYFSHAHAESELNRIDTSGEMGGGWRQFSDKLAEWAPLWTLGDSTLRGRFRSGVEEVDLFATQFQRQHQGYEAVNVSHRVYDLDKWSRISRSAKVVQIEGEGEITLEETLLQSPRNKKRLVWLWYRTNNQHVHSNVEAKINNLVGVMRGQPDIAVYMISKEVIRNEQHASNVLKGFVRHYLTAVRE